MVKEKENKNVFENGVIKLSVGSMGCLNLELKKPYKNRLSLLTEETIELIGNSLARYYEVVELNKEIEKLKEEIKGDKSKEESQ